MRGAVVFWARSALSIAALILLQSCAPQPGSATSGGPVTVNGTRFESGPAALAYLQNLKTNLVAAIPTEADPIKGSALVILPDHDRLRPLTNQQLAVSLKAVPPANSVDFVNNANHQDLRELADALVKNGTFQTVTIEERNDVIDLPTTGSDYVIVYQVRTTLPNNAGTWVGGWSVRRTGNAQALGASLDPGTPVGAPRIVSFVKSVHDDALRLGGTSLGGKTAASVATANGLPSVTSSGSGIIVDKQGDIITNAHVINACTDPRITDTANGHFPAHIVVKDQANDLALLKSNHHWPQPASFRDGGEPKLGTAAIVSGFPLSGLVASSMSVTAGTVSATAGPRDDSRLFQISAPVQPGNSGGPVLDVQGRVTGIVSSELNGALLAMVAGFSPQNVNFAIKAAIVRNFLAAQDVDFAHAAGGSELSTADVSVLARRFTVRIECGGAP
jgi:S1-C subfamily serine protease